MTNDDRLPSKFTDDERYAWKWLHDCGIDSWLLDMKTKEVHCYNESVYDNLVEFATYYGMKKPKVTP
jgi:hypothetical protein